MAEWLQKWTAEKTETVARVFYEGTAYEVDPPFDVVEGDRYSAVPDLDRPGFAKLTRLKVWKTPVITKHSDVLIETGASPGDEQGGGLGDDENFQS